MDIKKNVKIFYIIYTVYVLMVIGITDITFFYILPAILLMWANYYFFNAGYRVNIKNQILYTSNIDNWLISCSKRTLLFLAGLSIIFSILAVKFYTGQTPASLLHNLLNNVSVYYNYQSYFKEEQRYVFSLTKIPYIFMLFYLKFFLFYSYISFLIIKNDTTLFEKMYLLAITLSFVYVGIARGTNYEFFELVMIIIFVIFSRYKISKFQLPIKGLSKIFLLIGIMIFVFYSVVNARGFEFNYYISEDVRYDPNGVLSLISPFIAFVVYMVYCYFGFGFFFMATYINNLWLSSFGDFISGLVPLGYQASVGNSIPQIMSNLVDIGVKWCPDSIIIINNLGYFGLAVLCFLMGLFAQHIYHVKRQNSIVYLTHFIILLQMISLPVGNFVSTSSASKLILATLIIYWSWNFINISPKAKFH